MNQIDEYLNGILTNTHPVRHDFNDAFDEIISNDLTLAKAYIRSPTKSNAYQLLRELESFRKDYWHEIECMKLLRLCIEKQPRELCILLIEPLGLKDHAQKKEALELIIHALCYTLLSVHPDGVDSEICAIQMAQRYVTELHYLPEILDSKTFKKFRSGRAEGSLDDGTKSIAEILKSNQNLDAKELYKISEKMGNKSISLRSFSNKISDLRKQLNLPKAKKTKKK